MNEDQTEIAFSAKESYEIVDVHRLAAIMRNHAEKKKGKKPPIGHALEFIAKKLAEGDLLIALPTKGQVLPFNQGNPGRN